MTMSETKVSSALRADQPDPTVLAVISIATIYWHITLINLT